MALSMELLNLRNGLSFPEAYIKIIGSIDRKLERSAEITVYYYKDKEARDLGKDPISIPGISTSFIVRSEDYDQYFGDSEELVPCATKRQYNFLKTLALFINAIDV